MICKGCREEIDRRIENENLDSKILRGNKMEIIRYPKNLYTKKEVLDELNEMEESKKCIIKEDNLFWKIVILKKEIKIKSELKE
ncbi:MAG TPA: hypothetical protein ENH06_00215 [bacterium]|nr:hypothetical protein [bacterium]